MTVTNFSQGYLPPGVYIDENSQPILTTSGLPPVRLAIVGRAQSVQHAIEAVRLSDAEAVTLTNKGIIEASVTVTLVTDDTEVDQGDYSLEKLTSSDQENDFLYSIIRAEAGTVPDASNVWVAYDFVPVGYFNPRTFSNYVDVRDIYGPGLNNVAKVGDDPAYQDILSPVTLAAQVAFQNGATEVTVVPIDAEGTATSTQVRDAMADAYAKIETDYSITLVVGLSDGLDDADDGGAALDLRAHCTSTSAAGYFRIGIFGQPTTSTTAPDAMIATSGLASNRLVVAYAGPAGMSFYNGSTGNTITVGHQYLAAAYGGRLAFQGVQESLTHKVVSGFSGVAGIPLSNSTKNQYAAAGVALTEVDRSGRMVVRHGTSTDRSSLNTAEISITRARDTMVSVLQTGLDSSGLIGSPIDANTPLSVKSIAAGLLEQIVAASVIVEYTDLAVRQRSLDPSVIEVRFAYRPAYPLNYIAVSFNINVATGDSDLGELTEQTA